MSGAPTTGAVETNPFSARLRASTTGDHHNAEHSPFLVDLARGDISLDAYQLLLTQLRVVYGELEAIAEFHRSDPVAGAFVDEALHRVPALEADLQALRLRRAAAHHGFGPGPVEELPVLGEALAYRDRIRAAAASPVRFVAHHYTRYLGDLSGGLHIGRVLARRLDLDEHRGAAYFQFPRINDPDAFKADYRRALDEAAWSGTERDDLIDEVHVAYRLNTGLFGGIDRHLKEQA